VQRAIVNQYARAEKLNCKGPVSPSGKGAGSVYPGSRAKNAQRRRNDNNRRERDDEGYHAEIGIGLAVRESADDQHRNDGTVVRQCIEATGGHGDDTVHPFGAAMIERHLLVGFAERGQRDAHAAGCRSRNAGENVDRE